MVMYEVLSFGPRKRQLQNPAAINKWPSRRKLLIIARVCLITYSDEKITIMCHRYNLLRARENRILSTITTQTLPQGRGEVYEALVCCLFCYLYALKNCLTFSETAVMPISSMTVSGCRCLPEPRLGRHNNRRTLDFHDGNFLNTELTFSQITSLQQNELRRSYFHIFPHQLR